MTIPADLKEWCAISCPTKGLRFDSRTLELLDTNGDGRIRSDEILHALEILDAKGVDRAVLDKPDPEDVKRLESVMARQADLAKREPTDAEKVALVEWDAAGRAPEVAVLGDATAAAETALAAVEPVIDAFFTPPEDLPLVTENPDPVLPLRDHLNPKHLEAVLAFAEACVKPLLGEKDSLTRLEWKALKAKFAPYRDWRAAKPSMQAQAMGELVEDERLLRYRIHLGELLRNYVTMEELYRGEGKAIFQTGVLRIDGREFNLCFHVDSEADHSALVGKSNCCVVYLKLKRPAEGAERSVCAVVTAGRIGGLYVGRNGVFYDRDGKNWEAAITKVVEAQVSLTEAFWAPWRKLGEGVASAVKKFLGDRQTKAVSAVQAGAQDAQAGGAAMASSVAAIGIGVGMAGAALASVMAVVSTMSWHQLAIGVVAVVLAVSLPSVVLVYFKLRKRDLGAILNASGWAVNRELRFSMKLARTFTKCQKGSDAWKLVVGLLALVVILVVGARYGKCGAAADRSDVNITQEAK